jgi:hypothetical protein
VSPYNRKVLQLRFVAGRLSDFRWDETSGSRAQSWVILHEEERPEEGHMKIELTEKQYEALLKIVYLGSWIANSVKENPEQEYEEIEQYLFSLAKGLGMEKFVAYDEKMKMYYPTDEFESVTDVVELIEAYNEYTVWEALVLSLSRRDLIRKHGAAKIEKMGEEELIEKEHPFIQKYEAEFRDYGFDNLYVKPRK